MYSFNLNSPEPVTNPSSVKDKRPWSPALSSSLLGTSKGVNAPRKDTYRSTNPEENEENDNARKRFPSSNDTVRNHNHGGSIEILYPSTDNANEMCMMDSSSSASSVSNQPPQTCRVSPPSLAATLINSRETYSRAHGNKDDDPDDENDHDHFLQALGSSTHDYYTSVIHSSSSSSNHHPYRSNPISVHRHSSSSSSSSSMDDNMETLLRSPVNMAVPFHNSGLHSGTHPHRSSRPDDHSVSEDQVMISPGTNGNSLRPHGTTNNVPSSTIEPSPIVSSTPFHTYHTQYSSTSSMGMDSRLTPPSSSTVIHTHTTTTLHDTPLLSRRPLPDQTAFESTVVRPLHRHSHHRSPNVNNSAICPPPTPQRTPLYAAKNHGNRRNKHGIHRIDSLLETKVLFIYHNNTPSSDYNANSSASSPENPFQASLLPSIDTTPSPTTGYARSGGVRTGTKRRDSGGGNPGHSSSSVALANTPPMITPVTNGPPPRVPSGPIASLSFSASSATGGRRDSTTNGTIGRQSTNGSDKSSVTETNTIDISYDRDFTHIRDLGEGGFSKVMEAVYRTDGIHYAIKRSKNQIRSRRDRHRLLKEIRTYSKVGAHPHLIHYSIAWQEEGFVYFQMELASGGSLRQLQDHIEPGTLLPEQTIWSFIGQIADALAHLHKYGIVHLDVKPDNIFISRDGTLKLGDLGEATEYASLSSSQLSSSGIPTRSSSSSLTTKLSFHSTATTNGLDVSMNHSDPSHSSSYPQPPHNHQSYSSKDTDDETNDVTEVIFDGEGDSRYMARELLTEVPRLPSADIFSLGLSAWELTYDYEPPTDGVLWQDLRENRIPPLPDYAIGHYSDDLIELIHAMMHEIPEERPTAEMILSLPQIKAVKEQTDTFLMEHVTNMLEYLEDLDHPDSYASQTMNNNYPYSSLPPLNQHGHAIGRTSSFRPEYNSNLVPLSSTTTNKSYADPNLDGRLSRASSVQSHHTYEDGTSNVIEGTGGGTRPAHSTVSRFHTTDTDDEDDDDDEGSDTSFHAVDVDNVLDEFPDTSNPSHPYGSNDYVIHQDTSDIGMNNSGNLDATTSSTAESHASGHAIAASAVAATVRHRSLSRIHNNEHNLLQNTTATSDIDLSNISHGSNLNQSISSSTSSTNQRGHPSSSSRSKPNSSANKSSHSSQIRRKLACALDFDNTDDIIDNLDNGDIANDQDSSIFSASSLHHHGIDDEEDTSDHHNSLSDNGHAVYPILRPHAPLPDQQYPLKPSILNPSVPIPVWDIGSTSSSSSIHPSSLANVTNPVASLTSSQSGPIDYSLTSSRSIGLSSARKRVHPNEYDKQQVPVFMSPTLAQSIYGNFHGNIDLSSLRATVPSLSPARDRSSVRPHRRLQVHNGTSLHSSASDSNRTTNNHTSGLLSPFRPIPVMYGNSSSHPTGTNGNGNSQSSVDNTVPSIISQNGSGYIVSSQSDGEDEKYKYSTASSSAHTNDHYMVSSLSSSSSVGSHTGSTGNGSIHSGTVSSTHTSNLIPTIMIPGDQWIENNEQNDLPFLMINGDNYNSSDNNNNTNSPTTGATLTPTAKRPHVMSDDENQFHPHNRLGPDEQHTTTNGQGVLPIRKILFSPPGGTRSGVPSSTTIGTTDILQQRRLHQSTAFTATLNRSLSNTSDTNDNTNTNPSFDTVPHPTPYHSSSSASSSSSSNSSSSTTVPTPMLLTACKPTNTHHPSFLMTQKPSHFTPEEEMVTVMKPMMTTHTLHPHSPDHPGSTELHSVIKKGSNLYSQLENTVAPMSITHSSIIPRTLTNINGSSHNGSSGSTNENTMGMGSSGSNDDDVSSSSNRWQDAAMRLHFTTTAMTNHHYHNNIVTATPIQPHGGVRPVTTNTNEYGYPMTDPSTTTTKGSGSKLFSPSEKKTNTRAPVKVRPSSRIDNDETSVDEFGHSSHNSREPNSKENISPRW